MFSDKEQQHVQIIDLGMAVSIPEPEEGDDDDMPVHITNLRCCGKPGYMSPEVVRAQEKAYDPFAADIWSLGVCLYMMLTGKPLYHDVQDDDVFQSLLIGGVKQVLAYYEDRGVKRLSRSAKDLICRMLDIDPLRRPTLENILLHPFFTTVAQPEHVGCLVMPISLSNTFRKVMLLAMRWGGGSAKKCEAKESLDCRRCVATVTDNIVIEAPKPQNQQ